MKNSFFSRIIKAWLLVGTLDIVAASVQFYIKTGRGPVPILKYIASAVFGAGASKGGSEMIVAGLVFHYIIALLFTVFFFVIFSNLKAPIISRIFIGVLYGIFTWFITTRMVVPLSAIGFRPASNNWNEVIAASILIVCIGIPLALLVTRPAVPETNPVFIE